MEKYKNLNAMIDAAIFNNYYAVEGMSCVNQIMANITKEKEKLLKNHIESVYPIKETATGFYTKLNPKDRNHSGKISAKTRENLETKIVAYYLEIKQNSKTFKEVVDLVVEEYNALSQNATGIRQKQIFNKYFSQFADLEVNKLTSKMLENALHNLVVNGIKAKDFTKATGILNRIYRYCTKYKLDIISIPDIIINWKEYNTRGKHVFKQVKKLTKNLVFTEQETIELLKYALAHPSFKSLFIGLILTTGCRVGELLCMSYDNVDLDASYFHVYETEDAHTQEIKQNTKSNICREVYLNSNAKLLLNSLLKLRKAYKNDTKYLFLNSNAEDGKLHTRAVDNFLRELQKELHFDETKELRSLHDGRRTYATMQFLAGVDIKHIQRQLGHGSIAQTEEYIKDVIDVNRRASALEKGAIDLFA